MIKREKTNKIRKRTALKAIFNARIPFEPFGKGGNYQPVGSGNYDKETSNGRYRKCCNLRVLELTCSRDGEKRYKYLHCNKLDCNTCFIASCSKRAREMNEKLLQFKNHCKQAGINLGDIKHFSILFDNYREKFEDDKAYKSFKKHELYPMLKELGMIGGYIFLHIWSNYCLNCYRTEYECNCSQNNMVKVINIHVHAIGYGFIISTRTFRSYFPKLIIRKYKPRKDAYFTAFYALRKSALFKKENKRVRSPYSSFGYLGGKQFKKIKETKELVVDTCDKCNSKLLISKIKDEPITEEIEHKHAKKTKEFKIVTPEKLKKDVEIAKQNQTKESIESLEHFRAYWNAKETATLNDREKEILIKTLKKEI